MGRPRSKILKNISKILQDEVSALPTSLERTNDVIAYEKQKLDRSIELVHPRKRIYPALTTDLIRLQTLTANPRVRGPRRMSLELILCPAVYRESMPPRNPLEIVGNWTVREVVFTDRNQLGFWVEISMLSPSLEREREKFRR